jgi:hypothetical protein
MTTIGDAISRVRNIVKAAKEDPFLTDRLIFSLIIKHAQLLMKQQDSLNQLLKFQSFFKTLPCLELIEVDKVEACCDIRSGITIKRTKDKLPKLMEAIFGPLVRTVSSIDGSQMVYMTYPAMYSSLTKSSSFKYNKNKYFWYINDYLYFPNIDWEAIKIEGIFEDDIETFICSSDKDKCSPRQNQQFQIPDYLFAQIESSVIKELTLTAQLPPDMAADDKQNILR